MFFLALLKKWLYFYLLGLIVVLAINRIELIDRKVAIGFLEYFL